VTTKPNVVFIHPTCIEVPAARWWRKLNELTIKSLMASADRY